jgi:hypothetical protein
MMTRPKVSADKSSNPPKAAGTIANEQIIDHILNSLVK